MPVFQLTEAIWQRERNRILHAAEPEIRAAAEAGIAAIRPPNGPELIANIRHKVQERRSVHLTRVVTDAVHVAIAATDAGGTP